MVQPVRPGRKVQVNNLRLMTVVTWGAEGRSIPVDGWEGQWSLKNQFGELPAWEVTYPLPKVLLKIIILFSRWDMLVFWRVLSIVCLLNHIYPPSGYPVLAFGPIFYSSPVHSNLQGRFSSKLQSKKETGWVAGLVARFELVPICKEAESMLFFDVPLERCTEFPWQVSEHLRFFWIQTATLQLVWATKCTTSAFDRFCLICFRSGNCKSFGCAPSGISLSTTPGRKHGLWLFNYSMTSDPLKQLTKSDNISLHSIIITMFMFFT